MSQLGKEVIENLKQGIVAFEKDYAKFDKGNKTAGTRARKTAQAMKVVLQVLRVEIQSVKNKD